MDFYKELSEYLPEYSNKLDEEYLAEYKVADKKRFRDKREIFDPTKDVKLRKIFVGWAERTLKRIQREIQLGEKFIAKLRKLEQKYGVTVEKYKPSKNGMDGVVVADARNRIFMSGAQYLLDGSSGPFVSLNFDIPYNHFINLIFVPRKGTVYSDDKCEENLLTSFGLSEFLTYIGSEYTGAGRDFTGRLVRSKGAYMELFEDALDKADDCIDALFEKAGFSEDPAVLVKKEVENKKKNPHIYVTKFFDNVEYKGPDLDKAISVAEDNGPNSAVWDYWEDKIIWKKGKYV